MSNNGVALGIYLVYGFAMTNRTGDNRYFQGLFAATCLLFGCGGGSKEGTGDPALRHAQELLQRTILIDGHNDVPWSIRESKEGPCDVDHYGLHKKLGGHTDLDRMKEGRVGGQFWSV